MCISKLGQISRVKSTSDQQTLTASDQQTLTTIIDALVMSKIDYCSSAWANSSDENIKKIQLIQNFAARLITFTGSHKSSI